MKKNIAISLALIVLLSSCTASHTEPQKIANAESLTPTTNTLSISTNATGTTERQKSCISPYEMIERLKAVEIEKRHIVLQKIIEENGLESYFDTYYYNGEFQHNVHVPVIYEYTLGGKDVVLMLMKEGAHQYDYLLFVKEFGIWSMNCVVSVSERNKPYFDLEYTSDKEDFWLVYREEVSHGTGISVFHEIWVNQYGEEVLRYPAKVSILWETAKDVFLSVNYHTERSHSLPDTTINEYADYFTIPPYSVFLTCYVNFALNEYYHGESLEIYNALLYYWDKKEKEFVIDFENISDADYYTSFFPEDAEGKESFGENYFDYTSKYYKLFEEAKASVNTDGLSKEEIHQNVVKAFRDILLRLY